MGSIHVSVINNQSGLAIDRGTVAGAVRAVLEEASIRKGRINVVVVDDATIHDLNRRYLGHDYPTDVLSFPLSSSAKNLEGEVVVSADTACSAAGRYGWTAWEELLLYIIHGTLHLVGYDDHSQRDRAEMRAREREHLRRLGVEGGGERRGTEEETTKAQRHKGAKGQGDKGTKGTRARGR